MNVMKLSDEVDPPIWLSVLLALFLLLIPLRAHAMPDIVTITYEKPKIDVYEAKEVKSNHVSTTEIEAYIKQVFPDNYKTMTAIAWAESSMRVCAGGDRNNKYAVEGSWGLFQVNKAVHKDKIRDRSLCNYRHNIDIAKEIYMERERMTGNGYNAWTVYSTGAYIKYLK